MALTLASERIAKAERIVERMRELLIAAAREGAATGSLTINLKEGHVTTLDSRLVTGERDDYRFPTLI